MNSWYLYQQQAIKYTMDNNQNNEKELLSNVIVLNFSDSKIPVFKESRNKDYIKYGEKNDYPNYLTLLYNKSPKHNAIVNGKAKYIFGNGFTGGDVVVNRLGDTLNEIGLRCAIDQELYGGWRIECVWDSIGRICEFYHIDFSTLRKGKNGDFKFKECWDPLDREDEIPIDAFNPSYRRGSQVYEYNEYRPMTKYYPLPSYIGCNNYIETDIEISKYYLSAIRNGMAPSKMIQFYTGEPSDEKKQEVEKRFKSKFAGSENAGKFILVFNTNKEKQVTVDDLSASDLDKQFVELNKTVQQEIFSGHLVTSPALFGIKTEGQLGATNELRTAYGIFVNTYAKPKSKTLEREFKYLLSLSKFKVNSELNLIDPIDWQVPDSMIEKVISQNDARVKLGLKPVEGGDVTQQTATTPVVAPTLDSDKPSLDVNDNIKNLTTKQHQQLLRLLRQYSKGTLNELQVRTLLRTGLKLTDEEIDNLLGVDKTQSTVKMSFDKHDVDSIINVFDSFGDARDDFEILKSKKVLFSSDIEAEFDEEIYINEAFATYDVTETEKQIIELLKKDPLMTPEVIAKTIKQTEKYVETKLDLFVKKGYIQLGSKTVGTDTIVERMVSDTLDLKMPPLVKKLNPSKISIRYSYEGPRDSKNRPFCAKLLELNRFYTRADIEKISEKLGYSVFDRRGGFWTEKGTDITHPYCRHNWKSNIVVKKS